MSEQPCNPIAKLTRMEAALAARIDDVTARIDRIGTGPVADALARLHEAGAAALGRLTMAEAFAWAAVSEVIDGMADMMARTGEALEIDAGAAPPECPEEPVKRDAEDLLGVATPASPSPADAGREYRDGAPYPTAAEEEADARRADAVPAVAVPEEAIDLGATAAPIDPASRSRMLAVARDERRALPRPPKKKRKAKRVPGPAPSTNGTH